MCQKMFSALNFFFYRTEGNCKYKMALAAVSRVRKGVTSEATSANENRDKVIPSYLLDFPVESSRIKDLQLSVLLGRCWQCQARFLTENVTFFPLSQNLANA
jgi:hypothetical protein